MRLILLFFFLIFIAGLSCKQEDSLLIATVESAETSFRLDQEQESKLAYWYTVAQSELANLDLRNYELAGVA